jgi:hypothetical protein
MTPKPSLERTSSGLTRKAAWPVIASVVKPSPAAQLKR